MKNFDMHLASATSGSGLAVSSRRDFLARLAALPAAIAFAADRSALARSHMLQSQEPLITSPHAPNSRAFDFSTLASWITPNEEFFVRSHFGVPRLDPKAWTLTLKGALERPSTFTLDELMKLPSHEEVVLLECAGNLVGWGGVSTARWTGVRLKTLLEAAGVRAGAIEVVLAGADGGADREAGGIKIDAYARSIPLGKAMDSSTLLAYKMNGEALPAAHGGPLRAIVPGWYGMDSVKWLRHVTVASEPFKGFYQEQRYYEARRTLSGIERSPLGDMRVKSQIARPKRNASFGLEPVAFFGAAWSGAAEIERVELSFDKGLSWVEAQLGDERARFAWRLWSYRWTPQSAGRYQVIARARDRAGRAQPLERDPLIITPYANNWVDRRSIEVR